MKVIIAEKPSVAVDFAKALGNWAKKDGYIQAGDFLITWAVGHLLEIDDAIAPREWKLETLPILPSNFKYKVSKNKSKQFKIVKSLVQKAEEVYIGTDAGREGELIARLILLHTGWKKWDKTYRIWTSEALTKPVILREIKSKKIAKNWDSLYYSALARQHSDWLVGINLTRAITLIVSDSSIWSIGRVQTPILRLIVERQKEIENFKPTPYWQLEAIFQKDNKKFKAKLIIDKDTQETIFKDKNKVWEIFNNLKDKKEGIVLSVEKKTHKQYAPPLFSITTLQMTANKRFGYTATKTLSLAQDLYEAKYISYPRTEAQYLDENIETKNLVKDILKKLNRDDLIENVDKVGKRVFDSSKLTDHYAIIPMKKLTETEAQKEGLGKDHLNVYNLIKNRFLSVFMPAYEYEITKIILKVNEYFFIATGKTEINLGWKSIDKEDEEDLKENTLPILNENDKVLKISQKVVEDKTKPPPYYTESTLLSKMKQLELGTGATRAGIIQTLKDRFYIKNKGKSLIATDKGIALIEKVKDKEFASPEMTSKWEQELERIYTQKLDKKGYEVFLNQIKEFTKKSVEELKSIKIDIQYKSIGKCKCGGDIFEYGKFYQCNKCNLRVWKEIFSKKLKEKEVLLLFQGSTIYVEGLKGKSGKKFGAGLRLNSDGKVELVFDENNIDKPKCKCGGVIVEAEKSFYCKSCKSVVWKEMFGKKISKQEALKLFAGNKIKMKGFKSKTGNTFEAILYLEDGKPKIEFPKNQSKLVGKCKCGGNIFEYSNKYVCGSCKSVVWKEFFGKKISKEEAIAFFNGKTVPLSGLKSKSGKKFNANVVLIDNKMKIVSFEN